MRERSHALLAAAMLVALTVGVLHAAPQPDGPGTAAAVSAGLGAAVNRDIAARAAGLLETRSDDAWFGVPVYYLTSRQTLSAAEHLAMILESSGRALLIGEPTAGGNHFGGTEPVGGGLELFVPVGHTIDPATGLDWENIGVAQHVVVPAEEALNEVMRRLHAAAPVG